eukprot:TRINITY_DN11911_c0_g1_i2.p1 TRINITY_DN11911_c0_g1~~TRINITY_DN11911_c0_g1_i2.p1  ORF type:complete len:521 (+),score=90.40 TRINITY_DN11911_c0_g1_i2:365-1927(+)
MTSSQIMLFLAFMAIQVCAKPPHIVHIMADDLGFFNLGFRGNSEINSPTIDSLVQSGLLLDQMRTFVYCSPTRSSFLSGRLPHHVNQVNGDQDRQGHKTFAGVDVRMTTIAKQLQQRGYSTHQIGKWHAGTSSYFMIPEARGFNTSFGFLNGGEDHFNQSLSAFVKSLTAIDLWRNRGPAYGENGHYSAFMYTQEAVRLIEQHDPEEPFFLYMAYQNTHCPYQIPDGYGNQSIDDVNRRIYAAMVELLDSGVKNITDALKAKGMWHDTLLTFSSDNGGPSFDNTSGCKGENGGNNYPLKGGKLSAFDGGVRVNSFVNGGRLADANRGHVYNGYVHIADLYQTFCEASGEPCKDSANGVPGLDSLSMWPVFTAENMTSPRDRMILQLINENVPREPAEEIGNIAAIIGDYKFVSGIQNQQALWTGPQYPNASASGWPSQEECLLRDGGCLYNIRQDPEEHVNLLKTSMSPADQRAHEELKLFIESEGNTVFQTDNQGPVTKCLTTREMLEKFNNFFGPKCE